MLHQICAYGNHFDCMFDKSSSRSVNTSMTAEETIPKDTNSELWRTLVAKKQIGIEQQIPADWRLPKEFNDSLFEEKKTAGINLIAADIPRRSGLLSESELDITENYTATALLELLASGKFSSVEVTTAFCKRAAIAQQLISCLTETCFPKAIERAAFLDEYLAKTGKPFGPLHGLPISVKDSFKVKGLQSTIGYVSFLTHPAETSNSPLIDILLNLGAVIYVKTNIPQTMMTGDSENNIFGRTLNPHSTSLTAGGSSGGEGALVAFRGSILGVGTDVAGSIRIPSLCCGVYGFKPTADRIPFGDSKSELATGYPGIVASAGPLAHNLEDIKIIMDTVLSAHPEDLDVTAIGAPWSYRFEKTGQEKLTIGVLWEDPSFPLHPPVRRNLESAISALQKKGHKIVRLIATESCSVAYGNRLAFQYFTYVPQKDHIAASGEPPITSVAKRSHPMYTGPPPVDPELDFGNKLAALARARFRYMESWRQLWVDNHLDAILTPGAQNTAVPHDTYGWPPYTLVWNVLDYPACIIPYGEASKELDPEPMTINDGVQPSYNPEAVDGAPCALQVITRRFQDEMCLYVSEIIDRDIKDSS
ncbi:general amidase GmdB [Talaromyces stipitatus ATCC 10500]|uniref:amidase n=1 Tax=Talaromyces stipitatus (strain ATCC 10500 / CBS 375.48 / QM 6759 / NRRL 1006) TaxID=441959 RepID=B8MP06_TALSN|nr:general amidase GmdB [Talaromyces stipitatus ATCC 10500]EED14245.1 general amidase GmdB [Talaromyces stipitatus ATCC 10500]